MCTFEKAYNIAADFIGHKQFATNEEIDAAIENVLHFFPKINKESLKAELLANYSTTVDNPQILEGRERRIPWLKQFKADNPQLPWNFWNRYKSFLRKDKRYPEASVNQIDEISDKILDHLFNPQEKNIIIDKKGLVVGQVQSGKTANYTGLICKAADVGFNFIVVLAGTLNNLRSQTQNRLDEGFLGFDTIYAREANANETYKIGVGLIPGYKNAIANSITTSADNGDFTSRMANSLGINFEATTPLLLVIKKNFNILRRVIYWLNCIHPNSAINSKALLLIDDEADNASINTNRQGEDPTRINGQIRKLLKKFSRSAYVGYTATPFANIFIPLNADDLFPRDFIINIPTPNNYIGPDKIFGTGINPDEDENLLPIVNSITDADNFVPTGHRKDDAKPSYDDIPESLKTAIKCFILTCAIRIARGQAHEHNSMLIHVSRYQSWQNAIKEIVNRLFNYYKQEIEADDESTIEDFRRLFEEDADGYLSYKTVTGNILNSSLQSLDGSMRKHEWCEIKPLLIKAVQKIEVKAINGSSADSLMYYDNKKNGISVIVIGGDKLSRGLTLEGLSVSYFLRASKMYDTLMQMGRWFGYRKGYVDLCRLFTSPELDEWFRHITLASNELREEFSYLYESGGTPDSYALKVRTHPGCLQITSISKRRYTNQIQVSWAGRLVETYQLSTDRIIIDSNLEATNKFLFKLQERYVRKDEGYLWRNIYPNVVCDFLSEFQVGRTLVKVNLELIRKYIEERVRDNELTNWSVALMSRSTCINNARYTFSNGIIANSFIRRRATDTTPGTYYIRKNHIEGHRQDEFIDLDKDVLNTALEETRKEKSSKGATWTFNYPSPDIVRNKFRDVKNPLLLIYPLDANGADETYDHTDKPIIGLVIAFPHSNNNNNAVTYTVNRIAEYADAEDIFDIENDNEYD